MLHSSHELLKGQDGLWKMYFEMRTLDVWSVNIQQPDAKVIQIISYIKGTICLSFKRVIKTDGWFLISPDPMTHYYWLIPNYTFPFPE